MRGCQAYAPSVGPFSNSADRASVLFRNWIAGFLVWLVLSLGGTILIDVELKGQERLLFGPVFLLSLIAAVGCAFLAPPWRDIVLSPGRRMLFSVGAALAITFTSGGILNFGNALFSSGRTVRYSGPVEETDYYSGKGGTRYYVVIRDAGTKQLREFRVGLNQYQILKPGDLFSHDMFLGGLGYAYRWD